MELQIVDSHCHIFPPLADACGFPDAATHSCTSSAPCTCMATSPIAGDAITPSVAERSLWNADDPSGWPRHAMPVFASGAAAASNGRRTARPTYVQFLPPHMATSRAPAEDDRRLRWTMPESRPRSCRTTTSTAIWPRTSLPLGRRIPAGSSGSRRSTRRTRTSDEELAVLRDQVERLGMAGLYFTTAGLFRSGYRPLHDDPTYDPLWREAARLDLPVFWVQFGSIAGRHLRGRDAACLERIAERHPSLRHVIVHGVPTALYADADDRVALPDVIVRAGALGEGVRRVALPDLMGRPARLSLLQSARAHFRQLYDASARDRFIWGSDMPNVERYCTYRQSLTYAFDHFAFLTTTTGA